jgi:hypothetical protein
MENPLYLHYIYYHCTKKRDASCPERSVCEEDIDDYMIEKVENELEVSPALSEWCIQNLDRLAQEDRKNDYERKANWERELARKEKESDELVRMRMKELINDDQEFLKHKDALENDKRRIKQILASIEGGNLAVIDEAKKAFSLIVGLTEVFRHGTFDEKQEALSALGSNLTLKSKTLSVFNKELFSVIAKGLLEAKSKNREFEPRKCEADKDETGTFVSVRPALCRMLNEVRTYTHAQMHSVR